MDILLKDINNIEKELTIVISKEEVKKELEQAIKNIAKTAKINGFRQGKAPLHLIETTYKDAIKKEVLKNLLEYINSAIRERNIDIVSYPQITKTSELDYNNKFEIIVILETKPKIDNINYQNFKLTKQIAKISDQAVEEELIRLKEAHSKLINIDDPEKKLDLKDVAIVDLSITPIKEDGTLDKTDEIPNYSIEIGKNQIVPEIEDHIIGMKVNETKEFEIETTNPQDKNIKNQKIKIKVLLKEIKKKELPELTDDFIRSIFKDVDNLQQLKEKIRIELQNMKQNQLDNSFRDNILEELISKNDFDVPKSLIQTQKEKITEDIKLKLQNSKLDNNQTEKFIASYQSEIEKKAINTVKLQFLFQKIFEIENLKITQEDIENEFKKIKQTIPDENITIETIKKHYQKYNIMNELYNKIAEDKIFDIILNKSSIEYKDVII